MVETDDRDCLETKEQRRLIAPVTGDNLVAFVDQNGRVETEGVDASRDRPYLDPAMLARIARISAEGADRNQRQFSDAFGAFGLPFSSKSRRDRRCLDRADSARRRRPFHTPARRRRVKFSTYLRTQIDLPEP